MTQYGFEHALKENTPFVFTGYEDLLKIRPRQVNVNVSV